MSGAAFHASYFGQDLLISLIILIAFAAVVAVNQLAWIIGPITASAAAFGGVSTLPSVFFASFSAVYIVVSIPASRVIDTHGLRVAVGIGALLTGGFRPAARVPAANFTLVFICQIGIATGQPSSSMLSPKRAACSPTSAPPRRHSAFLGMYLGIVLGLALTPAVAAQFGLAQMLVSQVRVRLVVALVFLLTREHPPTPSPSR